MKDGAQTNPATLVPAEMDTFARRTVSSLEIYRDTVGAVEGVGDVDKLVRYAEVATALIVYFLEIHPFANGNGHTARFLLLALFARQNIFPTNAWPIHPRPADPPYSDLIKRYRRGDRDPLVEFVLAAL